MKKILLAIFALALTGSAMAQNRNQDVTFFVNFNCNMCIRLLEKEMPSVRGVRNYRADLRGRRIVITYNSRQTNPDNLRKALEKLDFVVKDKHEDIVNVPGRKCS